MVRYMASSCSSAAPSRSRHGRTAALAAAADLASRGHRRAGTVGPPLLAAAVAVGGISIRRTAGLLRALHQLTLAFNLRRFKKSVQNDRTRCALILASPA